PRTAATGAPRTVAVGADTSPGRVLHPVDPHPIFDGLALGPVQAGSRPHRPERTRSVAADGGGEPTGPVSVRRNHTDTRTEVGPSSSGLFTPTGAFLGLIGPGGLLIGNGVDATSNCVVAACRGGNGGILFGNGGAGANGGAGGNAGLFGDG